MKKITITMTEKEYNKMMDKLTYMSLVCNIANDEAKESAKSSYDYYEWEETDPDNIEYEPLNWKVLRDKKVTD